MSDVVIAGIGQTPVGEHWETSLRELAFYAMEAALNDAHGLNPQALYVGNMLAPALSRQSHLATLLADFAGLQGVEAVSVEAAGASGGMALRQAYLAIASGLVDTALVVGVEKITDQVGSSVNSALSTMTDSDYEAEQGLTPTAQAAMLMQRYLYEYKPPREAFGAFPIVGHANGASNPNAMFRRAINEKTYARADMVSAPLNMWDIAPDADGAAAVLLARSDLLPQGFPHPLVRIIGSGAAVDSLALHDRRDPLAFRAAALAAGRALAQAGITHNQVNLFELFDAYSIYGVLTLEAIGFTGRGEGWKLGQQNAHGLQGSLPISTFGGLKARGNPGGATGVYQAVEAALQLRGQAGPNQVPTPRYGLIQCLGGPASTAVSHVLEGGGE